MRRKRSQVLVAITLLVVTTFAAESISRLVVVNEKKNVDLGFVAPEICPEPVESGVITAAGRNILATTVGRKATPLLKVNRGERQVLVSTAAFITGDEQAAMLTQGKPWVASTVCRSLAIDAWFVGGSGAVESQSVLVLMNQAASSATAEVSAWTQSGPSAPSTITVPAYGTTRVSLDRYASASIVTRVRALSGRLGMYLLDRRARGLTVLGGDFVPQQAAAEQKVVLLGATGGSANVLRLLVPGTQDAVIRVDANFGTDQFTPNGLDSLQVKAGTVVDIPVQLKNSTGFGALTIQSDVPVVAGVYVPMVQRKKQVDFTWIAPSLPLTSSATALGSSASTLLLFSAAGSTSMAVRDAAGRAKPAINVENVRAVPLKSSLQLQSNSDLFAAQIVRTKSGISVMPVNPLERAQKRFAPLPDLGVLSPRQ